MTRIAAMAARAAEIYGAMSPYDDDGSGSQRVQAAREAAREAGVSRASMALAVRQIIARWEAADFAAACRQIATPAPAPDPAAAAEREFRAAQEAAAVDTVVHDPDGGVSVVRRVPADWTLNGARTISEHLRAVVPGYAEAQKADETAARSEAEAFAAAVGAMPDDVARAAYHALSAEAKRELPTYVPKSARRRFI